MHFVSWAFIVLFLVNLAARLTLGRRKTEGSYLLVLGVSSLVFYAWHIPVYLCLLVFTTAVDYVAGSYLGRPDRPRTPLQRKLALIASLTCNLGVLSLFKYGDFALRSLQELLSGAGFSASVPELGLLLPMGISFYTFQSMSYTIDVYRGSIEPVRSYRRYLLFVSFFPQLVAGPIVRASEFLPQIARPRQLRMQAFTEGAYLMVSGFFLKMVCADNLAVFVDAHWEDGYATGADSGVLIWLALMFGCQIFCDFAGYTNIARGLGYMLGFRIPANFNAPYIAGSFMNFWQRWHITLSRWLRDYVYGALRGTRRRVPIRKMYAYLLLTMVLGGLWHGAAYTFIVWGALHGLALVIERMLGIQGGSGWRGHPLVRAGWFVVVQTVVLVGWVFFRSDGFVPAARFLANVAALDFSAPNAVMWEGSVYMLPVVLMHAWKFAEERRGVLEMPPVFKAALAGVMLYLVATAYGSTNAFIYFQF